VHLDALLTAAEAALIPALAEDEDVDLLLEENIVALAMQGPAEGVVDYAGVALAMQGPAEGGGDSAGGSAEQKLKAMNAGSHAKRSRQPGGREEEGSNPTEKSPALLDA
jgi:hypothetical protein